MSEKCDRCGVMGHDRRTLWMACFYAMHEIGVPFKQVGIHGVTLEAAGTDRWGGPRFDEPMEIKDPSTRVLYTLRVCKGCRADWMGAIRGWFRSAPGENAQWNNDADGSFPDDTLPGLVAEVERLRTEADAIQQRIAGMTEEVRRELDRREREDAR